MPAAEVSFPRGGNKPQNGTGQKPYKSENLFTTTKRKGDTPKKRSKKRKNKAIIADNDDDDSVSFTMSTLTVKELQEGMRLLACVHNVTNFTIKVELPDDSYKGQLQVTSISQQFSNELEKNVQNSDNNNVVDLNTMFKPGQFLPVVVQEKSKSLLLTTDPKDVNRNCNHVEFSKNKLIWAAVESHLDHGYVLNAGVANCRIFLPHEKVPARTKLSIGTPIWCVISRKVTTPSASNLIVSTLAEDIKKGVDEEKNLHYLIPGAQVDFEIEEVMDDGLKGNIFGDCAAYVNVLYYKDSSETHLKEGDVVKARVLYVRPLTNVVYLTLKSIELVDKPNIEIGQICKSQVIRKLKGGLCVKLNDKHKGFVSYKRLDCGPSEENQIKAVMKKYRPGTTQTCRVLDYNYLNEIYVCTFEKAILKERFFTVRDVRLGQKVDVKIKTIKDNGLVVAFGRLSGFIPNLHLSNVLFTENVKRKFTVGQNLQARVWNITKEKNILLTSKRSLVDCDLCLTSIKMAIKKYTTKGQYPGVVVKCDKNYVVVAFYGDIRGIVTKENIPEAAEDVSSLFFRGQVVMTTIIGKDKNGLLLSLLPPDETNNLSLGDITGGVIENVDRQRGIYVKIADHEIPGFIPVSHIGADIELNRLLTETYELGDTINNLVCIAFDKKNQNRPILSLTEKEKLTVFDYDSLKKDSLIRCYFLNKTRKGIVVFLPVTNWKENVFEILNEHISDDTELIDTVDFHQYQAFTAKVLNVDLKTRKITLSIKLSDVKSDGRSPISQVERYVNDIKHIKLHPPKSLRELSKVNLGQRVECLIKEIMDDGGCLVTLPAFKNTKGFVNSFHTPDKFALEEAFEGVVLWVDFVKGYVELSLNPDVVKLINKSQTGGVRDDVTFARILSISDDHLLGVLKSSHDKQLVVLPVRLHENDFEGLKTFYEENYTYLDKIRVTIKSAGGFVVGFHNKATKHLKKKSKETVGKKRSLNENGVERKAKKPKINGEEIETMDISNGFKSDDDNNRETPIKEKLQQIKEQQIIVDKNDKTVPILSGASNFFSCTNNTNSKVEDSSSSDDEDSQKIDRPKKKISPAEQAELIRREEERLSRREKELADLNENPNSADDFERLLRGNPNSSKLWAQYVAFHLAAAEIEKARNVARKALETIDLRRDDEKFNVWITLLNLENMYGTKETFETVFEEAVRSNDALGVYIESAKMLAGMNKFEEADEKINKAAKKFSDQYKMWSEMMKVYYKHDKIPQGRIFKNRALKAIDSKKKQIDLLVQAALLEFGYAEEDHQGEAIFENIIASHPQRVDVWCTYVDQFVKKGNIDAARRVLERSVCQKLPSMKMKKLFKKFLNFEQSHGNSESVEHVKQLANDYVNCT